MKFISYYTDEYQADADRLIASLDKFGLPHSIDHREKYDDWNEAVNDKVGWILGHLLSSREAVCWVDSDCEIMQVPRLLLGSQVDFAAYNWSADPEATNDIAYDPNKLTCSGGTLYFAYTAPAIELLLRWQSMTQEQPQVKGSDPVLDLAYNHWRPPCRVLWLPKSYGRIENYWPDVEPVIDHHLDVDRHEIIGGTR